MQPGVYGIFWLLRSCVPCCSTSKKNKYISSAFSNNQPDAEELAAIIPDCLKKHPDLTTVVAALESTPVYSIHIANYRKPFIGMSKTDPLDASPERRPT